MYRGQDRCSLKYVLINYSDNLVTWWIFLRILAFKLKIKFALLPSFK